ncbi:MAG TPA: GNAT family protein [Bacillales bacterium]|nr:GNAT family protein [Bacillales bacterium]
MKVKDIFGDIPTLETERLILRKLTMDDAEDLFEYSSEPEVSKYLPWETHRTIGDSKEFISMVLELYETGQLAPWGIMLKENEKLVGTIDFVHWLPKHHRAEISFVLSKKFWGNGYILEATRRLLCFGFEQMELQKIEALSMIENVQSQRVLQKLGMRFEGVLRNHWWVKDRFRDIVQYSILKKEFMEKFGLPSD